MDYQIIKQGENQLIKYTVEEGTEIDAVAQGMLINNTINGLVPLNIIEKDGLIEYSYDITGLQKVSDIFEKVILKQGLLTLLISVAETVIKSRDYMILEKTLEFEPEKMFSDFNTGTSFLLCIPFKRNDEEIRSLGSSCIEILKSCHVAQNESSAFIRFLIDYLEQEERTADQILEIFQKVLNNDIIIPERPQVQKHAQIDTNMQTGDKQFSVNKSIQSKNLASSKAPTGIRTLEELMSMKKGSAPKSTEAPQKDVVAPYQDENEMVEVYEETGLLEDNQFSNNEPVISATKSAYLIRLSNQERIPVNSRVFVIGRSAEQADYAIVDNKWISNVHCSIISTQDGYYVRDLGSMNHTYLNDNLITTRKEILIPDDAIIRLGNERFRFKYGKI